MAIPSVSSYPNLTVANSSAELTVIVTQAAPNKFAAVASPGGALIAIKNAGATYGAVLQGTDTNSITYVGIGLNDAGIDLGDGTASFTLQRQPFTCAQAAITGAAPVVGNLLYAAVTGGDDAKDFRISTTAAGASDFVVGQVIAVDNGAATVTIQPSVSPVLYIA